MLPPGSHPCYSPRGTSGSQCSLFWLCSGLLPFLIPAALHRGTQLALLSGQTVHGFPAPAFHGWQQFAPAVCQLAALSPLCRGVSAVPPLWRAARSLFSPVSPLFAVFSQCFSLLLFSLLSRRLRLLQNCCAGACRSGVTLSAVWKEENEENPC